MDYILKKQKETSIEEYVSSLHSNGIDAYKRSHLPNFPAIKGGVYLGEIKKVNESFNKSIVLFVKYFLADTDIKMF